MKNEQKRNEVREIPVSPTFRIVFRILMTIILPLPIIALSYWVGLLMMNPIYLFWHRLLGFDWTAGGSIRIDPRRFLEFWHTGFGMYIVNVAFYTLLALKAKIKIRYETLAGLVITFIVFANPHNLRGPSRSVILADLGYSVIYALLFAMIMFAIFTLSTILLDKLTKMTEPKKILLSFGTSCVVGFFVSWLVWLILFRIFHG